MGDVPALGRARRGTVFVGGAVLGVLVVLGLAPAASFTADRLPEPLTATRGSATSGPLDASTRIRPVPVGLPDGTTITSVEDVRPWAVAALGGRQGTRALELLTAPPGGSVATLDMESYDYPFHYTAVDDLLRPVQPEPLERHGAALGAALVRLAAQPQQDYGTRGAAARLAFGVLERARAGGGCDAQLDLLLLVASDNENDREEDAAEFRRAERACPGDPTPGWVYVQSQLQQADGVADSTRLTEYQAAPLKTAQEVASALTRAHPSDPGVLATLGDAYLTAGTYPATAQPFTARRALHDAEAVFTRITNGPLGAAAALGAARARLGLADPSAAARLARTAAEGSQFPARALALEVRAEEKAHRFEVASALARRLADAGRGAYPAVSAVIPLGPPLSVGFDALTPLTVSLLDGGQGGGGTVVDEGFVPTYRDSYGLTNDAEACPAWVWRRDALLAGNAEMAAANWPEEFEPADPVSPYDCPDDDPLKEQVDLAVDGSLPDDMDDPEQRAAAESLMDDRQNLFRWAGDLAAARRASERWAAHLGEHTALAQQRIGEIDYLSGQYAAAAAAFAEAAVRWRTVDYGNDLAVYRCQLAQAAALTKVGRVGDAEDLLGELVTRGAQGYGYHSSEQRAGTAGDFARISYYASTLRGDQRLAAGQPASAGEAFAAALLFADPLGEEVHTDVARNSAAIAALASGDTARAVEFSRQALEADPASPVYLMTAAEVARAAGDEGAAVRQGRAALASDPTDYPAANNLGVLLARQGRFGEASRMLRAAVHENPAYAVGWFNLGIVEGRRGPLHVLASQGALARAVALDAGFADRPHHTVFDTTTYRTSLDVSKPIASGWSFSASQRTAPALTLGVFAAVLAGVGLVSLRDPSASGAREWLEGLGNRLGRVPLPRGTRRPQWAVAATVAAFLLAFWRDPLWPWTGVLYVGGLLALVGAGMVARWVVARRRVGAVVHGTWSPGVAVGLVSGALGVPIAPLPVVRAPSRDPRVALAAPLTLASLCIVLLAEAVLLHTPVSTSWCVAAFIMAGSVLLPVAPLDGSRAGAAGVAGAAGLLGAVLLLGLGLA